MQERAIEHTTTTTPGKSSMTPLKIRNLRPVKESELKEYREHMEKVTIPKIVATMKKRAIAAEKARHNLLWGKVVVAL